MSIKRETRIELTELNKLNFLNRVKEFYKKKLRNAHDVRFDDNNKVYFNISWRALDAQVLTSYLVELALEAKVVAKMYLTTGNYTKFDRDELKFFDTIEYNIKKEAAEVTGQDITDWF